MTSRTIFPSSPTPKKYRPRYPSEWFAYLASTAPGRQTAWDCGTGNGQAALGLAAYFDKVIATDASQAQIEQAIPNAKIDYRVAPAENSGLPDHSVSLVTAAQAVHWFDHEKFYAEVKRVLEPQGLLALWTYGLAQISPEIDSLISDYYHNVVGRYWPPERKWIEQGYQTLLFPFEEVKTPPFEMRADWTAEDCLGYLGTWSATQRAAADLKKNPLEIIKASLKTLWKPGTRIIRWPLDIRVGKI